LSFDDPWWSREVLAGFQSLADGCCDMTLGHGDTEFPEDVLGLIFVQFHRIQPLFHSDLLGNFIAFSAFLVKLEEKHS